MTVPIRIRLAALAAVALLAFAGAAAAAPAREYVPFETDFPKTVVPVEPAAGGRAWGDVALGGGLGIALVVASASVALAVRAVRRRGAGGLEPHGASQS